MRVPVSWLREFVDAPETITPEELHAALVRVGFEEEDHHGFDVTGPVVVGQILEFVDEPQSNGKTIRWVQVDVGEGAPRGIVCGAHNFVVGDKVVVSLPGAVLPGPFPISARKTYGHVSDGMIASARELGLGDEHDGILRLVELGLDAEPGTDAIALLGLDDWAVEINVTPDRGYALSIRGVAREYSHSTGVAFRDPAVGLRAEAISGLRRDGSAAGRPGQPPTIPVTLDDQKPIHDRPGCSLFATRIVRGVDPGRPTPPWMVARLALAGIRSISLTVDVSNYVMIELGQPTHCYDLDLLQGAITVRRARPGERITTLDDQDRALDPEDLLIADEAGPIGIAGVMGGARTENSDATVNVLIEAANFDPVSIARSARRHKLWSEASKRFERGVDPAVAEAAANRVAELLVELAGGVADEPIWVVGGYAPREPIALEGGFVDSLIGAGITDDETVTSLRMIGATVTETEGGFEVAPPTWRPDLNTQPDLAEEVARIVGYDRIPATLPTAPPGRGLTREQRLRRSVANTLAANGLTEVMAYPFLSAAQIESFSEPGATLELVNPLDGAAPFLRRSLIPGLLSAAQRNRSRGLVDVAIFEVGSVYTPVTAPSVAAQPLPSGTSRPTDATLAALDAALPPQPRHLGVVLLGDRVRKQPGQQAIEATLTDALDAARQAAAAVGAVLDVAQSQQRGFHPGRTASLSVAGEVIGVAGELLPSLALELDLPARVAVVELNLDRLLELAPVEVAAHAIGTLPAATQDVSLVVKADVPASAVHAAFVDGAGELLEHAELVDDYRGQGVDEGTKSLTFALRFRAFDRTLTAAEATESKLAGVASAAAKCGALLRE
ncbi:MAG: phenylalanine--tRNA ligase subunit beta [Cryobacterium sp.]|nr:phenylalanine--tRNA ligase subunit beta [Cryobacterium sp.]